MQPDSAARLRAALQSVDAWPPDSSKQRALTDALLRYLALIAKWNRTYNLTAVRDVDRMLVQHLFDCAAIAAPLKRRVERRRSPRPSDVVGRDEGRDHDDDHYDERDDDHDNERDGGRRPLVIDVGSGAGLPGVVLALLWPEVDFVLVEPVAKKAAFLQQVKTELALANVDVVRCKIEDLPATGAAPDAIVCRAFASLADYATAVESLAGPRTVVAAMKARPEEQEKRALTNGWRIAEEIELQVPELDARRSLVVLERARTVEAGAETT